MEDPQRLEALFPVNCLQPSGMWSAEGRSHAGLDFLRGATPLLMEALKFESRTFQKQNISSVSNKDELIKTRLSGKRPTRPRGGGGVEAVRVGLCRLRGFDNHWTAAFLPLQEPQTELIYSRVTPKYHKTAYKRLKAQYLMNRSCLCLQ